MDYKIADDFIYKTLEENNDVLKIKKVVEIEKLGYPIENGLRIYFLEKNKNREFYELIKNKGLFPNMVFLKDGKVEIHFATPNPCWYINMISKMIVQFLKNEFY